MPPQRRGTRRTDVDSAPSEAPSPLPDDPSTSPPAPADEEADEEPHERTVTPPEDKKRTKMLLMLLERALDISQRDALIAERSVSQRRSPTQSTDVCASDSSRRWAARRQLESEVV